MIHRIFICFFFFVSVHTMAFAQQVLNGQVVDEGGQPLPNATIVVKGTSRGTAADEQGRFKLEVADGNAVIVITYQGYLPLEAVVGNELDQVFTLQVDEAQATLDEVVVIGYQAVRRKDLTGATGIVNTAEAQRTVARSLPESLQGLSSGITVRNGGAPGQEAVVNIRGLSTFYGNANPLYVIDGMFADPNTTVNPADIESVQVLKDASAAAIYGSRAANGVVIITTKKGRPGEPKFEVSARQSVSTVPRRYDMMDGPEYAATNRRAYEMAGYAIQPGIANYQGDVNTNWADELLRTGAVSDLNASISGGSENTNYLISAGYFKDKGTLIARDFERMSLRVNGELRKGRVKIGENIAITNSTRNTPFQGGAFAGNPWYDMWTSVPILPVRSDDLISGANPGGWGYGSASFINTFSRNQVAIADITSTRNNFAKIIGNAYVDVDIINGLSYRFNAGLETSFDKSRSIRKDGSWYQNQSPEFSSVGENRSQFLSYLFEHTVNYDYNFGKHHLNGVVGFTQQTVQTDNVNASRLQLARFGGEYFTTINSATGDMAAAGSLQRYYIDSYLGRINYTYDDRYLATFTFRSDKDSRFSPDYRVGNFPSVALGWRLSNEEFFDIPWVNDFKVRGSYGVLGAANLSAYEYIGYLNQGPNVVLGPGQETFPGAIQARLVYEDLRWESKATTNIGFDATVLDNQVMVGFDIFRSVSKDVLVGQPLPMYLGNLQGDPLVNIGSIENKGIEIDLGYRPQIGGEFKWDVMANVSFIRNKVLELGSLGVDPETGLQRNYITSGHTRTQVGRSVGEYFLIRTDGLFQSAEEIAEHRAQADIAQPGDIRYVNLVDGGTGDDINDNDRTFAGSPWPKFTAGMQFNAAYKNFTLGIQLHGVFGHMLYNDVRRDLDSYGNSNYRRAINPWTPENTNTSFPRLGVSELPAGEIADRGIISNARANSDRWLEDGSFLRLRNVELGYTIPDRLLGRIGITNTRVYVSGQNLFTLTGYTGLDPDVTGANANLQPGVDNGNYPASRIISFGLGFGF
ncbi:TonB-linked outer membrane protein, SusC/RagA family [Parapedobacter luteus]|uniref:TonB-linked outer membrane protein, SusC/RagA family n=1 Tax=Parapedobacter luteus TaxID=623280 RepID=A0A1T5BS07_9SPHI|nr:TonB-dependent receptor [Parapedobacter luteus]SKB49909.1 TonB-linked outer membrane protein, SusC/RagA family [Parapedobacter luteus]